MLHLRDQFPGLKQKINDADLVYFDSAATTLKPQVVIDRITQFYTFENCNVHRGAHTLSQRATAAFEKVREQTAHFLGAGASEEIVFTFGTTAGMNLIADSFGGMVVKEGDEILITEFEHHAGIVPWQVLAEKKKAHLKVVRVTEDGELDWDDFTAKLNAKTRIFSFTGCSNTLGTVLPIKEMIQKAKSVGAFTVVDAAQLVSRSQINVRELDCDFLVFSAHKLFGPTGVGVLYGKKNHLDMMPPYQTGGSMISEVSFEKTTYNVTPYKFEAGTPHIAGVLGLGAALDFFSALDFGEIVQHEAALVNSLKARLQDIPGVQIFGNPKEQGPIISFNVEGVHHSDLAQLLDEQGIAVRAGHLCTQPLLARFKKTGTLRVSFSIYNTLEEVERFEVALRKSLQLLR